MSDKSDLRMFQVFLATSFWIRSVFLAEEGSQATVLVYREPGASLSVLGWFGAI